MVLLMLIKKKFKNRQDRVLKKNIAQMHLYDRWQLRVW